MKSLVDQIPVELMQPWQKSAVMAWIKTTRLPYRFRRKLLQDWGAAMNVPITTEDYMAITDWQPGGASLAGQRT
jgi:hypothetical protein